MKKIINSRLYNTETAKFIGSWSNGLGSSDFHYCTEDLYQKKTGEYFLYGSGGAMCWGEDIIPMTEKEVKVWAETHLTADEYMELFEVEE